MYIQPHDIERLELNTLSNLLLHLHIDRRARIYIIFLQMITFYGSRYIDDCLPVEGSEVSISGLSRPAVVNNDGMYIFGSDGKKVHTLYMYTVQCTYMYMYNVHVHVHVMW